MEFSVNPFWGHPGCEMAHMLPGRNWTLVFSQNVVCVVLCLIEKTRKKHTKKTTYEKHPSRKPLKPLPQTSKTVRKNISCLPTHPPPMVPKIVSNKKTTWLRPDSICLKNVIYNQFKTMNRSPCTWLENPQKYLEHNFPHALICLHNSWSSGHL